jgi:hypothetical protein
MASIKATVIAKASTLASDNTMRVIMDSLWVVAVVLAELVQ